MSQLVADCPRCRSKRITFDLTAQKIIDVQHRWQKWYEAFCICRYCNRATIFTLSEKGISEGELIGKAGLSRMDGDVSNFVSIKGYVSLKDQQSSPPPEHLPKNILAIYSEGTTCFAVGCFNAAGTMFRLCMDLATKSMLPEGDANGLNAKIRRNLGLRLPWLFANRYLPEALQELSLCVKEDGNDGAHDGTLIKEDAEDLQDFTAALLERLYTEPYRLRLAKERREARRAGAVE